MTTVPDERPMVHVRLPKPLLKEVDHLGVEWETDRAHTVERLLAKAIEALKAVRER